MALTKFIIPPDQASYSVQDGQEVVSVKLEGGLSRYRKDILNASSIVNVQWSLSRNNYQYLRSFYKTVVLSGALPFLIDLYLDSIELVECEVYFVPNSLKLVNQRGFQFVVSAQLEVKPIETDDEFNQIYVDLTNEYGSVDAASAVLNSLEKLTNVNFPESIGP